MKNHSMSNLRFRSVLLGTALAMGAVSGAHAREATASCLLVASLDRGYAMAPRLAPLSSAQAAFSRADTNQDGKLSRQEAEHFPAMAPHFRLIDTNRDNFLSFEELNRAASEIS